MFGFRKKKKVKFKTKSGKVVEFEAR